MDSRVRWVGAAGRRPGPLALGFFLALALVTGGAWAQTPPIKFGKPTAADFAATAFGADSAAAAVVLCDYGSTRILAAAQGLQMEQERVCRIKILKKAGFDLASVAVALPARRADVLDLKGCTYNLVNGQVVKSRLESDGKYTDDVTRHLRLRKFTLPDVRVGSVIEYSYTLVVTGQVQVPDWEFQRPVPVLWSEYRVTYPVIFDYRMVLHGYVPVAVREQNQGNTLLGNAPVPTYDYRWVLKDVPAFAEEPFMTVAGDYLARLEIELVSVQGISGLGDPGRGLDTWKGFDNVLMESEDFGRQLAHAGFLADALAAVPAPAQAPPAARAAAVCALVREAVKFDGRDGLFASAPLRRTFLETHRGNAADVNLLLVAALRAAGLPADPVVLSTRDHGRFSPELPLARKFNYVVAHALLPDGQELLLDATDPLLPAGTLPERCLNQSGRLVRKDSYGSRFLTVVPAQRRVHYQQATLALTPQGGLSGTVHEEHGGYAGAAARAELLAQGEARFRAKLAGRHPGWTVPRFAVADRADPAKPLAVDYDFAQPAAEANGPAIGTLYFSLFDEFNGAENPFRSETRTFPVDFGTARDETIRLALTLPPGYEAAELPKPAIVELPDGGGRYQYTIGVADDGAVQVVSRLSLRKPVYAAAEYVHLRELYRLMLAKQAEKLVIKKKV